MSKGEVVGAIVGIGAIGGALGYVFTRKTSTTKTPPSPTGATLSSIGLTASPNSAVPDTLVEFTATAYDQSGNPFPKADLVLIDKTTSVTTSFNAVTDVNGNASVSFKMSNTGKFVFYAEPKNATSPTSNTVTVTITPTPTCNTQQYYSQSAGQCVCYSAHVSNLALSQQSTPDLTLQVGLNYGVFGYDRSAWSCWINPTSAGSCPTYSTGGSPSCLTDDTQYITVSGTATDSNGNPCGDVSPCRNYKVYFWFSPQTQKVTISNSTNNSWVVEFTLATYDQNNNPVSSVYADANGNFTVKVGISLKLVSATYGQSLGNVSFPFNLKPITLYAGFHPDVAAPGGVQVLEFNTLACMYTVGAS